MLKAIICLPFQVLVVIPGIILFFTPFKASTWYDWQTYVAILLTSIGLPFAIWTMRLFATIGKGTPAPWNPTTKLIIAGPYCYVRNPMLSSVFILLIAEALYFNSWGIAAWFAVFVTANLFYFPLSEEPGLRKRFGEDYDEYFRNVPRYIPRMKPWKKEEK